jgi:Bacterial regulatory proteins, luxR family
LVLDIGLPDLNGLGVHEGRRRRVLDQAVPGRRIAQDRSAAPWKEARPRSVWKPKYWRCAGAMLSSARASGRSWRSWSRATLNKQVGSELDISEITVKGHRGNVMRKMNARSLPDLVTMAALLGLLPGPAFGDKWRTTPAKPR